MNDPVHEFGSATSVDAEAIGEPGQRRFRLLVRSTYGCASVWMEKEQLAGVGSWLSETVEKLDSEGPTDEVDVEPLPFPEQFDLDLRAAQLALGYVEDRNIFALQVYDLENNPDPNDPKPVLRCFLSRGQSRVLSRKIAEVIAGGRKPCPLCGEPLDAGGHVCPRGNGHRPVRLTQ